MIGEKYGVFRKITLIGFFWKNTLKVNIKEEIPIGIYENNNQKILFSKNLVILEILGDIGDPGKSADWIILTLEDCNSFTSLVSFILSLT